MKAGNKNRYTICTRLAFTVLISLLLTIALTSCRENEPENTPSPTPPPVETQPVTPDITPKAQDGSIADITELTYSDAIEISSGYSLVVSGWYPQTGVKAIDEYYKKECEGLAADSERIADELRSYDDPGSYATQYMLDDNYAVVRNSGDIFSVHRMVYIYTGGAHGNHGDVCDNFRISDGSRLTLDDVFDCTQDEYVADICNAFDAFIDSHSSGDDNFSFFEDAKTTLRDMFPHTTFCITETGLVFYLSPYFVTPYTSGTVAIPVEWSDLTVPVRLS